MNRLSISLVLAVLLAVVGTGWLIGQVYQRYATADDAYTRELKAYEAAGAALVSALEQLAQANIKPITLAGLERNPLSARLHDKDFLPLPAELANRFNKGEALTLETEGDIRIYYQLGNGKKILSITPPLTPPTTPWLNVGLTALFYGLVIGLILMWLAPLLRQLKRLRYSAARFGQGELDSRVELQRGSYIRDIELSFNNMAERIEALVQDNKLLSRAVSHDLKTPLARLRFGIDVLSESHDPEQREKYQARINADLEEMESLVATLLQYAALDEAQLDVQNAALDLLAFCEQKYAGALNESIALQCDFPATAVRVLADERYLVLLLNNLISNARHYANSRALLRIRSAGERAVITVEDDGAGVPEQERNSIFKPFARGAQAQKNRGGHGMGLAIAARVANWLHAELRVENSTVLGGARFVLELPLASRQNLAASELEAQICE